MVDGWLPKAGLAPNKHLPDLRKTLGLAEAGRMVHKLGCKLPGHCRPWFAMQHGQLEAIPEDKEDTDRWHARRATADLLLNVNAIWSERRVELLTTLPTLQ